MNNDKWIRREPEGTIDLEAQFKKEFYSPSPKQRAYLAGIEAIEPVSHKQAAAIVLATAHAMFHTRIDKTVQNKKQLLLFK